MSGPVLRVRRATVEDLDTLRPLWSSMHLSVAELEPRLTEFQIVEDAQGKVVGGIGFEIAERQGRLHSEGFTDFAIADAARELFWNRIQMLASNFSVLRIWTQENTPFWSRTGFKRADAEVLKRLPGVWNLENAWWLTMQLKDEEAIATVEQELAKYMATEKRGSDRVHQHARVVKTLTTLVVLILVLCALGALVYVVVRKPDLLHPNR